MQEYSLYKTFNVDSKNKERITVKKLTELADTIKNVDESTKEAFILLICEHARIHDEFECRLSDESELTLPYGIEIENDGLKVNLRALPKELSNPTEIRQCSGEEVIFRDLVSKMREYEL